MERIPTTIERDNTHTRVEVEIPDFVYNGSSIPDIEVDIASITLTPGTWVLGYDVNVFMRNFSGAGLSMSARVRYTDNSNNFIFKTASWNFSKNNMPNNEFVYRNTSRQTEVTITETTTYKLRLTSNIDGSVNQVAIAGSNVTASVSGSDNNSTLWAERKRLPDG